MKTGDLSEADLDRRLAEIESLADVPHHLKITFTQEQDRCLIHARAKGVSWPRLVKWWHAQGWRGSDDVLRMRYRELCDAGLAD